MRIDILTLFPSMFSPLNESIIGRAVKDKKVEINVYDIRDYSLDKHKKCDDYTFGGGAGMVMMPQPIATCIDSIDPEHNALRIYMSPKGKTFCQSDVSELLTHDRIILLCGHYEGVDQRVLDLYFDRELSIGDYVLTGGELPAMVVTDAVCRYIDGVLNQESLRNETFNGNAIEYPQYTRPRVFMGLEVPEVLIGGNHGEVDRWRKTESERLTKKMRPDLYERLEQDKDYQTTNKVKGKIKPESKPQ